MQQEHVHRNGRPVAGFGLGIARTEWVTLRDKLQDMDHLVATGRGGELVDGRTALATTVLLRQQMAAGLGNAGVGHLEAPPAAAPAPANPSPWKYAVVMSVASAVTGWVLEEIARRTFRKKRR